MLAGPTTPYEKVRHRGLLRLPLLCRGGYFPIRTHRVLLVRGLGTHPLRRLQPRGRDDRRESQPRPRDIRILLPPGDVRVELLVARVVRFDGVRDVRVRRHGELRERDLRHAGILHASELPLDVSGDKERIARHGRGRGRNMVVRPRRGCVVLLPRRAGVVRQVGHDVVRFDLPRFVARGHHRGAQEYG